MRIGWLGLACAACVAAGRPPPAAAPVDNTASVVAEGSQAPEAQAIGLDGKPARIADYRGKLLVLYFYPTDFASGATALASELKADLPRYKRAGAAIVGASTDEVSSHRDFSEKLRLPFPLLSDPGGRLAQAFGVPLEGGTAKHVTFLIDRQGVVRKVWRKVNPWGHSAEVLAAIKAL